MIKSRKNQILIITVVGFVILSALFFIPLKSSAVNEFPVPITSRMVENTSSDEATYEWVGINRIYLFTARLRGWGKPEQMGSMYTFEKDGEKVGVITFENGFSISNREE